jgi:hypothetical protein
MLRRGAVFMQTALNAIARVLCILAVVSCVPARRRSPAEPDSVLPKPSPIADSNNVRTLVASTFSSGEIRYSYRNSSTIQSTAGDSVPRVDSVQVVARLAIAFQPLSAQQTIPIVAHIDSLQVTPAPNGPLSVVQAAVLQPRIEINLAVDLKTGRIVFSHEQIPCTQQARELVVQGNEMLPNISPQVPTVTSWVDTTVRQICRGGITLRITQAAHYQLITGASSSNVSHVIVRNTDSQIMGNGSQWQQIVQAAGRSVATDTFFIARSNSRIVQILGSSRLEISFQSERRSQQFLQVSQTQITAY